MTPRITTLPEKKCIGNRMTMSLANNQTRALWQSFMPGRNEIANAIGTELYSIQVYPPGYFNNFTPQNTFEKWAAIAVADYNTIPAGMEPLIIPAGEYAVFLYKGPASAGAQIFEYIFTHWLPNSAYILDNRPHFEILGEKYKGEDPASEEEIWIPVKRKG